MVHKIPLSDVNLIINPFIWNKCQESWDLQYTHKLHQTKGIILTCSPIFQSKIVVLLTHLRIKHSRITHIGTCECVSSLLLWSSYCSSSFYWLSRPAGTHFFKYACFYFEIKLLICFIILAINSLRLLNVFDYICSGSHLDSISLWCTWWCSTYTVYFNN